MHQLEKLYRKDLSKLPNNESRLKFLREESTCTCPLCSMEREEHEIDHR